MNYETKLYELVSLLLKKRLTGIQIMRELGISRYQFYRIKDIARLRGIEIDYHHKTKKYTLGKNRLLSKNEEFIINGLDKLNLSEAEINAVLSVLSRPEIIREPTVLKFSEEKVRFGICADMHFASKFHRHDIWDRFVEDCIRSGVDFVLNGGDTVEGFDLSKPEHIHTLEKIGATAQVEMVADKFAMLHEAGLVAYSVEPLNSHGGWAYKSTGLEIGDYIESKCYRLGVKSYHCIGYDEQDITINGIKIRIRHPNKGYIENYITNLAGGYKPHMVIDGHFHSRAGYQFLRNVHAIDAYTMQSQTQFLRRNSSNSLLGYWICEMTIAEAEEDNIQTRLSSGKFIESLQVRAVPFYD